MTDFQKGLKTTAWITIGFGLIMLILVPAGPNALLDGAFDLLFWPAAPMDHLVTPAVGLLSAITGGIATGWGVLILGLAGTIATTHPAETRKLVIRGFLAWFIVDGIGSVLAGAPLNLVGNALFLAAVLWPIRAGADAPARA